ncbi:hypothetical protein [Pandoraea iniqua]|uniref:hypothetical protein n=1 Tax=Pandoraea iniqua TaxID=2508288 RepID=UPI0015827F2E|nr:hypothetical protein [Pandoraea iniqua]
MNTASTTIETRQKGRKGMCEGTYKGVCDVAQAAQSGFEHDVPPMWVDVDVIDPSHRGSGLQSDKSESWLAGSGSFRFRNLRRFFLIFVRDTARLESHFQHLR